MHFYFIRHAQSTNNALYAAGQGDQARTHDPALTPLGRQQAECLADYLARSNRNVVTDRSDSQNRAGFGLTHLYCSLMVRAVATGAAVAERLGLPLRAWLDWHEEGGLYLDGDDGQRLPQAGPGRADFARDYPGLLLPEGLDDAGWWNKPFEEPEDRPLRARRALAELVQRHGSTDDRVAVYHQRPGMGFPAEPDLRRDFGVAASEEAEGVRANTSVTVGLGLRHQA